ncbi:FecR family protein [Pedobacter sp. L105]|uniref:FecR family protein n=1 Tax=Pedobacter sp. L105 TaxID=1641871 RepID=UPI00131BBC76|nr:FecR family protein [Pedobacter sp. L105]
MKKEDFLILAGKIAEGNPTDEDILIYNTYLNQIQNEEQGWHEDTMGNPQLINDELKERVDQLKDLPVQKIKKNPSHLQLIGLAASILIVFAIFLTYNNRPDIPHQTILSKKAIVPGSNKATLTLANGKQIILDHIENGKLANEKNILISKSRNGELTFQSVDEEKETNSADLLSKNIVSTPNGGQYQVDLSDGTKVWLNAKSTLKFPSSFKGGKTRQVELTGEAYFEVAKNPEVPFIVSSNQMKVKVLGTHFNIKAYDDEQQSSTTLLQGSVSLSSAHGQALLKPGQQGLLNQQTGKLAVSAASDGGEGAIAWKNGDFMFVNEDIYTVMRQISRWYDVEIEYKGNFKDLQFRGEISRFKNINEVLKLLQLTDAVHFKVVGRRIIVMT